MSENIHPRATTTPFIRKQTEESKLSNKKAAKKFNVSVSTIEKWRKRESVKDRKSGAPSKSKHITPAQEAAIVAFRIKTQLSLYDCYEVFKEQITRLSFSAIYRVFKRHGINKLPETKVKREKQHSKNITLGMYMSTLHKYTLKRVSYIYLLELIVQPNLFLSGCTTTKKHLPLYPF